MSIWLSLAEAAVQAGSEKKFWSKLERFTYRKRRILVLGASGAGKTQFVHSLLNPTALVMPEFQRTTAVGKKKVHLNDVIPFLVTDTPGQVLDEAKRKPVIAEAQRVGFEGIINVVCFGYHEAAEAGGSAALPPDNRGVASPGYLKARRGVEIAQLSEWVPRVDAKMAKWVLTVVTKADLWWPDAGNRLHNHYSEGDYADALADLPGGAHHVVPYCSVIAPFYGGKTSGRFGDVERAKLRAHLIETVISLTGLTR